MIRSAQTQDMATLASRIDQLSEHQQAALWTKLNLVTAGNSTSQAPRYTSIDAFVTTDGTVDEEELQTLAKDQLASYMVPTIHIVDTIPRLPNGKVNRRKLPSLKNPPVASNFQTPQTEVEIQLAHIWCDLLGVEVIDRQDSFFEIGGDSLIAIQLISRIREQFEIEQEFQSFFDNPTIAAIAERIEAVRWLANDQARVRADDEEREQFEL